jgi:cation diffusion facilitator family transporter
MPSTGISTEAAMHIESLEDWEHDHVFGQDLEKPGEKRTLIVVGVTAVMMVAEIIAGIAFGSMALLADGLHMASHALALGIAMMAYVFARRLAGDERLSFGTGKFNSLGGFTGALLLLVFAAAMAWESAHRLMAPTTIEFNEAIFVAVIGLVVNVVSAVVLLGGHDHHHGHEHAHAHDHDDHHDDHGHGHHRHHDHNLRAAYLHVLADAMTSVLAIVALTAGKYFGAVWLDATMGIVGSGLILHWSYGLLRDTGKVLLDWQAPPAMVQPIRDALETGEDRITDLHVWSVGPGIYSASISLVSHHPASPDSYRERLPKKLGIVHATFEIHKCEDEMPEAASL